MEPHCVIVVKTHKHRDIALDLNLFRVEQKGKMLEKLICRICNTELLCLLYAQLLHNFEISENSLIIAHSLQV